MSALVTSTRRRDPVLRWLILLILWLLPLTAAWWLGGAEWALRLLRVLADSILPHCFPQGVSEIVLQADQSWKVRTGLTIQGEFPAAMAIFFVDKTTLLRIVMGFPLLWALLLATPGSRLKRIAWGTLLLGGVSLLGISANMWAMIAVMFNHQASLIDESLVPPPFQVSVDPYPEWLFHLSTFAHYLAVLIVPVIAPVLIWVMLCPRGMRRLLVSLRRRVVKKAD
jgi:hypothetical protein